MFFFFFKQKTAYERRISDWSSDVCSSDLRHHALSESAKDCVMQALRLAEQLGGDTAILHGNDITAEILAFARSRNVSQIVIGRTRRSRWSRLFRRTLTDDLQVQNDTFDVLTVAGEDEIGRAHV